MTNTTHSGIEPTRAAQRHRRPWGPSPSQVVLLQAIRSYPAISLLMNTTSAPQMRKADADRLAALADDAERRLRDEGLPGVSSTILAPLRRLVRDSTQRPTDASLCLFASEAVQQAVVLPLAVRERVVVDPTFATRDLVRALHRTPRHLVLVLTGRDARLFDCAMGELRPALRLLRAAASTSTDSFLRRVDRALGAYRSLHPSPLVLVAAPEIRASFLTLSRHAERLVGTVAANVPTAPLPELAARVRPVLEQYLLSREHEALELLDRRQGAKQSVSGMRSAWLAARHEQPEMLAVEEGLFYPARLSNDGDWLTPATDIEHPEVIDDAVDELIELVLERGGWVALVADGRLQAHDGVALTLKAAL
jgi:hypothetical protein